MMVGLLWVPSSQQVMQLIVCHLPGIGLKPEGTLKFRILLKGLGFMRDI
jgi:hypothetical protein